MTLESRNSIISVVLGIVIIGLAYWLYHSITAPYKVVAEQQQMTKAVRQNMDNIRVALIQFKRLKGQYPPTKGGLDSLLEFVKTDSVMKAKRDSLFHDAHKVGYIWSLDSLIYSPRPPHEKFKYTRNDTTKPVLYLLQDPGSNDQIGSIRNTTLLNVESWKQ
jgi:type II secretory pathway pseudopilin PulG